MMVNKRFRKIEEKNARKVEDRQKFKFHRGNQ